jgi:hypothetical protein
MSSGTAQVSHQFCHIFGTYVCLFVRVTMVDKKHGCRLLFPSQIAHNLCEKKKRKRKM